MNTNDPKQQQPKKIDNDKDNEQGPTKTTHSQQSGREQGQSGHTGSGGEVTESKRSGQ